jgi:hypothetical protein
MSHYAELYANPQGPGDTRPTALLILKDEGLVGNMTDKVFLVTGASSGIGVETARALQCSRDRWNRLRYRARRSKDTGSNRRDLRV